MRKNKCWTLSCEPVSKISDPLADSDPLRLAEPLFSRFKDEEIFKSMGRKKTDDILDAPPSPLSPCCNKAGDQADDDPGGSMSIAEIHGNYSLAYRGSIVSTHEAYLPDVRNLSPTPSPVSPCRSWSNGSGGTGDSSTKKGRLKQGADASGTGAATTSSSGTSGGGGVLRKSNRVAAKDSEPVAQPSWSECDAACDSTKGSDVEELHSGPATRNPSPSPSSLLQSSGSLRQLSSPSDAEQL